MSMNGNDAAFLVKRVSVDVREGLRD